MIGLVPLQHEIDGEKDHRSHIGQLAGPCADGEEEIFREVGGKPLQPSAYAREIGVGSKRKSVQLIQQLGLTDRVHLLGTQGETEVLDLLQRADAFVLPSVGLGEAGPISLMEAMSCAMPCISSIIGSTPDILADGVEGFLIPQGDEGKLTNAMVRLCRDVEERRQFGVAARRHAVAEFDCIGTSRRLLEMIEKTANVNLIAPKPSQQ